MSKKSRAMQAKDRPSDAWQCALNDLLNCADELNKQKITKVYFYTYVQGLCESLNRAGHPNYSIAIGKDQPFPDSPPDVEIGALKAIEMALRQNIFDPAYDDMPRLKKRWEKELRDLQGKALRAVTDRLRELERKPATEDLATVKPFPTLGIEVDFAKKIVTNTSGQRKTVEFEKSAIRWHIFKVALEAHPDAYELDALKKDYPGEDNVNARKSAITDLNKELRRICLRVENRKLTLLRNNSQ
jgi:hypothetical protein